MPVPSSVADLSTTPASNYPRGSDPVGTSVDDYLRTIQAMIKQQDSKGADIASATTITIPAAGKYFIVTGTTTIATIADSWTGRTVVLKFSGACQLTHSSGLILPGAASITTAAGDCVVVTNESTGVWRVIAFQVARERDVVSVKDFGAIGDGVTDDSAAFLAAIRWAMLHFSDSYTAGCVYVPTGKYLVTANNFLGAIDFSLEGAGITARAYFSLVGEGWSSQIIWRPSGGPGDFYMYYNDGTTNNLIEPLLSNLFVHLDSANAAVGSTLNGFYEVGTSPYPTQGVKLDRCKFVGADYPASTADILKTGTLITTRGTVNADLTNMIGCRVRGMKTLLDLGANSESVCHTLVATDAEVMYGDVFKTAGGSSVTMDGGSITMMSQGTSGQNSYLLSIIGSTVAIAGTFTFNGVRCELNLNQASGQFSNLLVIDGSGMATSYDSIFPKVNFNSCNFYPVAGTARNTISIDAATKAVVNFTGCDLRDLHKVYVYSTKSAPNSLSNGPFTAVTFRDGGAVAPDLVAFADSNSVGRVSARNCAGVLDYDLACNGSSYAKLGHNRPLKTATIWGTCWPDVSHATPMSIKLPPAAIIKAIRVRKEAGGASATSYGIKAVDGSLGVVYGASTVAAQNAKHEINVDDINKIAATDNQRFVFIITDGVNNGSNTNTPMNQADYAMVDYY